MHFITWPYSQLARRPFGQRLRLSSEWPPKAARASETFSSCSSILKLERWSASISRPRACRVRYLIYVAITALGRVLIEIVGAEHRTGTDILVITGAILLLSFAVLVLRFGSYKYPSERPAADLAR